MIVLLTQDTTPPVAHGVLVVDKPAGITSHDVVDAIRRVVGTRRVGHLGTLDPAATGVLPVAVGKATRLARYLRTSPKEYTGQIHLGWETSTGDAEGDPLETHPVVGATLANIARAMGSLTGPIKQLPPAYSAKKVGGVAAYKLARMGRSADLRPVQVTVHEFELVAFDSPIVEFRAVCSTGTYVRSLARDLGQLLGTGAHLRSLRRTRAGIFTLSDARQLDEASAADLIPSAKLMAETPSIVVDTDGETKVRNGSPIPCPRDASTICILNKNGELIAIGTAEKGFAHPRVVLL